MSDAIQHSKKKFTREDFKRILRADSTRDAIFIFTALFVILPVGLIFVAVSYKLYSERKDFVKNHKDFEYTPDIRDFLIGVVSCFTIYLIRETSIKYIFKNRAEKTVVQFPDENLRKKKVEKAAFARFRILWYIFITLVGYYCLKDEEWLPRTLGGKARTLRDLNSFWEGLPYQHQNRKVVVYYMIQFGSALCTFVNQFKKNRTRTSYGEFLLHDMATLMLITLSYLNNYLRMGAVILFLHDISDIFSYGCKIYVDTDNFKTVVFFYISLVVSWTWTRLIVYPFQILLQCFTNNIWARPELVGYMIIAICLIALQCLHIYWITIFIKIGKKMIATGETDDMQDAEKTENFEESKFSDKRNSKLSASTDSLTHKKEN